MKLIVKKNRELLFANVENVESTQNENNATTLDIVLPDEFENYNKQIVFITPNNDVVWDIISNNQYKLTNSITQYEKVDLYIWLTKDNIDFRTQTKPLFFYNNKNPLDVVPPEQINVINNIITILNEEIEKVENLNITAEKSGNITTLTLTDKNGTKKEIEIYDGKNGKDGKDGEDYIITQQDYQIIANIVEQDLNIYPQLIQELQEENQRLRNDLEASTLTVSAIGETIELENTAEARFKKFEIQGNSKQETREGYNLLDVTINSQTVKGVTFTINEDKSITCNGTADGNIKLIINPSFNLDPNTDYILDSGSIMGPGNSLTIKSSDNETTIFVSSTKSRQGNTGNKTNFNAYIYFSNGTVLNDFVISPMVVKASDFVNVPPYEEYGVMPSIQYPSEIKNVSGNIVVKIEDENNTKNQTITFPLGNLKFMKNDTLINTGIKLVNEEILLTGNEIWNLANGVFYSDLLNSSYSGNVKYTDMLCTHFNFKGAVGNTSTAYSKGNNSFCISSAGNAGRRFYFREDSINSLEDWILFLQTQYQNNTPVIVNYQLLLGTTIPYTNEQQTVYNQIKNIITSYNGETNIYSTNEVSPVFNIKAYGNLNLALNAFDNRLTLIE